MASRRVRIKGIANIPQRRKAGNEAEEQKDSDSNKLEELNEKFNLNIVSEPHANTSDLSKDLSDSINESEQDTNKSNVQRISEESVKVDLCVSTPDLATAENISINSGPGHTIENVPRDESVNTDLVSLTVNKLENDSIVNSIDRKVGNVDINVTRENYIVPNNISDDRSVVQKVTEADKVPNIRRKFLKPQVCVNIINRKPKERIDEIKVEPNEENIQESANINLNEIEISANTANSSVVIQKSESHVQKGVPKISKESTKSGSDTEYQHPPASPTKILNRRIKATPKLHQRRTSFSIGSASESEDDSRRTYSRIRNDSVCSVASGINENHSANEATSPTRKECTVVQRKCRKTDQTRKFAEARREFNIKFNNGKPDKHKLTMIDLIFYNPATSPMSYNKRKRKGTSSSEVSVAKSLRGDMLDEEKVDEPQPLSESDNDVPAPQIKVGANGEIVVDEKSLVIENVETKRGREALQMSAVVNGDDDTTYGVFKRVKRSKDWSKDETLRFYKALNTIGTDFTMMCELFPNRTRRELKMKFKKEERLNQSLIDRAVMQPIEFDMTELRRDLELEERRAAERKKRTEQMKAVRTTAAEQRKTLKKTVGIKGIDKNPEHFSPQAIIVKKEPRKKRKKSVQEVIRNGINGVLSDSDDDMNESSAQSPHSDDKFDDESITDHADDISNILKPTRYGRIPKARLQDDPLASNPKKRKVSTDSTENDSLEPGSIMIVKSKTPNDQVVFKVYIVTDNNKKQQIKLEPNVLQNLTGVGTDNQENENKMCDIEAHNIFTISAQEYHDDQNTGYTAEINNLENSQFTNEITNNIKVTTDSIVFPFDECITPTAPDQNITVSHEDNKMTVVTENKTRVLTTI